LSVVCCLESGVSVLTVPRNIEVKVRVDDLDAARRRALARGAHHHAVEKQVDCYYRLDLDRRAKLRTVNGQSAHLIEYHRPETSGVRTSDYTLTPVRDSGAQACLVPRGKPLVVVSKEREILLLDNVRIHLDRVDGLGTFLELEAVVDAAHDDATCHEQIDTIMTALGVSHEELVRASYAELLSGCSAPSGGYP
jgi:adenylate cyclase, class 2